MKTLKKRKSGKKGFTLMEMLIVVAIIGILIAIALPTFNNALTKARISADEANLRSYYAEVLTDYMLNAKKDTKITSVASNAGSETGDKRTGGTELKNNTPTKVEKFQISGADYTLQAGSCTIQPDDDNGTLTIVYTPSNKKFPSVTIPNGKTEEQNQG